MNPDEFAEFEQELPPDPAIEFTGTLADFDPEATRGERYIVQVRQNTFAFGEFVSKPPQVKSPARIVGYKWEQGRWLFETAKNAETRRKQAAISPALRGLKGELATRLEKALLNAKTNNLIGSVQGITKRGSSGQYKLATPYQGSTSLNAYTATQTETGEVALLLADGGQWIAFGNDEGGSVQSRRDIERSSQKRPGEVTGRVGYLVITQVGKRSSAGQTDPNTWDWFWQVWVGGLTENMILVKEWRVPLLNGFPPGYWQTATPPGEALLDVRSDAFYVSLKWTEQTTLYTGSIDLYWGLFKGDPNAQVTESGAPTPAVEVVWQKKDLDFPAPRPSTLGLTCVGFGYWIQVAISTDLTISLPTVRYAMYDGDVYSYPQTVNIQEDSGFYAYRQTNAFAPIGKDQTPLEMMSTLEQQGNSQALQINREATWYRLYRVSESFDSQLIFTERAENFTLSGSTVTPTSVTQRRQYLNDLEVFYSTGDSFVIGSQVTYHRYPAGINLPGISRDVEDKTEEETNQLMQTTITMSPFRVTTAGHRGDGNIVAPRDSSNVLIPSALETNTYTVDGVSYSVTRQVFNSNYSQWFYRGLYDYSFAEDSRFFCDVYSDYVAVVPAAQLANRSPLNLAPIWKIFPEITPSNAPQEPSKTTQELEAEETAAAENIEHIDREVVVKLLNPGLDGSYEVPEVTVEVLHAKQILLIIEDELQSLQRYSFCNASFGAD